MYRKDRDRLQWENLKTHKQCRGAYWKIVNEEYHKAKIGRRYFTQNGQSLGREGIRLNG